MTTSRGPRPQGNGDGPPPHRCPDPGCSVKGVPHHHFACPADWRRLPGALQRAIQAGYRSRRSDNGAAHGEAMVAAVTWYQDNPRPSRPAPAGARSGHRPHRPLERKPL